MTELEMAETLKASGWLVEQPSTASIGEIAFVFAALYSIPLGAVLICTVFDYFGMVPYR